MKRTLALWFLLWPCLAFGQVPGAIVLGGKKPTAEAVADARAVIAAAEEKTLAWNVGEFDLITRGPAASGLVTFDSTDDTILTVEEITVIDAVKLTPALWINDVRAGQKAKQFHKFAPQKEPYWVARAAKEGRCQIKVWANGENGQPPRIIAKLDVQVGKPKPTPPDPDVDPPGPVPIPDTGLRVLIVWETRDLSTLPASQVAAVNSTEVRQYLNAKCVKVGNHPEWRVYDPDTDVSRESKIWQDAMKRPRQSIPWILVSDGKTGYEGPLPQNKDDMLKLLRQFGGQ